MGYIRGMSFQIHSFVAENRRIFIWAAFFLLVWAVIRMDLFGLAFITFIFCFVFHEIITWLAARIRLSRRLLTVLWYLVFIVGLAGLATVMAPRLGHEINVFAKQLPAGVKAFLAVSDQLSREYPDLAPLLEGVERYLKVENFTQKDVQAMAEFIFRAFNSFTHAVSLLFLGALFSFLILMDFPRLREQTQALKQTRLRGVYEETSAGVAQFGRMVGRAFQAQISIAMFNTLLTGLGLWILDIPPVSLLCSIVFICGLVPVLGTFMSSVPIMLLALNAGGPGRLLMAGGMILVVHAVENYFVNPRVYSRAFKLNPVLTLFILVIAYKVAGLWGMLLGVPVSVFTFRYAIRDHGPEGAPS